MTRYGINTAQEMKVSIKDFFSKYDQIRRKLRILSRLLKKSLMENFIFCAVEKQPFTAAAIQIGIRFYYSISKDCQYLVFKEHHNVVIIYVFYI